MVVFGIHHGCIFYFLYQPCFPIYENCKIVWLFHQDNYKLVVFGIQDAGIFYFLYQPCFPIYENYKIVQLFRLHSCNLVSFGIQDAGIIYSPIYILLYDFYIVLVYHNIHRNLLDICMFQIRIILASFYLYIYKEVYFFI